MKKYCIFILLNLFITSYTLPAIAALLPVSNGDFEGGWSGDAPVDWETNPAEATIEEETNPSYVHGGSSSVKINTTVHSSFNLWQTMDALLPVVPSSEYTIRAWFLENDFSGAPGWVGISYYQYNADKNLVGGMSSSSGTANNPSFVQESLTFTTDSQAAYIKIIIRDLYAFSEVIYYVDDVTLEGEVVSEFRDISIALIIILSGIVVAPALILKKKNHKKA